ncbi:MAG: hypothetical protein U5L76_01985 [Patescibacteria group bacterium]|nr:hypothetical protein [Patescibacteria group bacterium]
MAKIKKKKLEDNISVFSNTLPYWAKYLAKNISNAYIINDDILDAAYNYFLEDEGLKEKSTRPNIVVDPISAHESGYKKNLVLKKIKNVEGVNILAEEQLIKCGPNITIIYGKTGSGKTGYGRLLKKTFFSRSEEDIIPNINVVGKHKNITAKFAFESEDDIYELKYPDDADKPEFRQFAVFDNNSVKIHLDERNKFEFRPKSLEFFGKLNDAIEKIKTKLDFDIVEKQRSKDYLGLFDGESDINNLITNISDKTKIKDLDKHLPFTEIDKEAIKTLEEEKIKLLTLKKVKEIDELDRIKGLIANLKLLINDVNKLLNESKILEVKEAIKNYAKKHNLTKKEGLDNFKSDSIKNIGSKEWKNFIQAADKFAKIQYSKYPKEDDKCILCQQTLSEEAIDLINRYRIFIKSQAEVEEQDALKQIDKLKEIYKELNLDLFNSNDILTIWLSENKPTILTELKKTINSQKKLVKSITADLKTKSYSAKKELKIDVTDLDIIVTELKSRIKKLENKEPKKEIKEINKKIDYLKHKEKLSQHEPSIKKYINKLKWAKAAERKKSKLSSIKSKSTKEEKRLSVIYFSGAYIKSFKKECKRLRGNFGVEIKYTGSSGTSFRELKIKKYCPSGILSEGEQKVISLADFISEIRLSGVNKGIIFDDPVTSLDDERKENIAKRLAAESKERQVIIFTHDLVFLHALISGCADEAVKRSCHWIEQLDGEAGKISIDCSPALEKKYKKPTKAQIYYKKAKNSNPQDREVDIKNGFTSLRTSYEALVIFELFGGVVERFSDRIKMGNLEKVIFNVKIRDKILDSFAKCCRFMEGHLHSDKYSYKKPTLEDLNNEINRFIETKKELKDLIKSQK